MANQIDDKPSLPSHLVRCEYLECTGTQYIDLGYPLGYNHRVVVGVEIVKSIANSAILGNTVKNDNKLLLNLGNFKASQNFGKAGLQVNLYKEKRCVISLDKEGVSSDNDFYAWTTSDFITEGNVILFGCKISGAISCPYKGKLYSCQIYENDVLIHDYIPCYNTENYRPCMYDITTGIELYNVGTLEFIYHIADKPIPYLAFEALEDDLQVSITKSVTQYSLDRVTWIDLPAEELTKPISKGEKVWFRANITPDGATTGIGTFSCTKKCNLEGTPMSLLYGDKAGDYAHLPNKAYCFGPLFRNNDNIIRINNPKDFLPAAVLTNYYCYRYMFYGCSNLVNMCYLPALGLTESCYDSMYNRCSSLVEIFDFPEWTKMASFCCQNMFAFCTSVKKQPKITTKLESTAYSCFIGMFAYCTNMEECQEVLQFTRLAQTCYDSMYRRTAIRKAPGILATEFIGTGGAQMRYMFADCQYLETPPSNLYATEGRQQEFEWMFLNDYNLKKSPILHQKESVNLQNRNMFENCINLKYIVLLQLDPFTNTVTADFQYWVQSVSPTGTIVLNKNIEWNPDDYRGVNGIPAGWEVKYCDPDNIDDVRDYREIDKVWNE